MEKELFNEGWLFYNSSGTALEDTVRGKAEPVAVTLPHDAMVLEKRDPDSPTGNATGFYPYKTVHYLKKYRINKPDGSIYLSFEGVYMNTAVYVNGALAARHSNGYTPFTADISPYLTEGDNTIKVLVRNGAPSSRWYTGTGIYRNVYILRGGSVHIAPEGVKVTTLEADSEIAVLSVETIIVNRENAVKDVVLHHKIGGAEVSAPVTLPPNETKKVTLRVELEKPGLWSPEEPKLYTCETEIVGLDSAETRFGIRTMSLDTRRGLRLNGIPVKLRGGCIHHDNGVVGAVETRALTERKIRKLKDAGYNAVRTAHFPASPMLLEVCDEVGMLVMNELCDAWTTPKVELDYSAFFADNWEKDAESMVNTSYNHPSVIMYSIGNEIFELSNKFEAQHGRKIADKIRSLDKTRYITNGVNIMLSVGDKLVSIAAVSGLDINSIMNGNTAELLKLMTLPEIEKPLDEAFSYLDVAGYNYGHFRYFTDAKTYPQRILLGSETFPASLYDNWSMCGALPQLIGDFSWTAWDYIGEAGVGQCRYGEASDYDLYGAYPWKTAFCGDFDLIGDRRPVSYWREIVWGLRIAPYIAVQDPAHFGEKQSPTKWGWSDAERSWNHRGFEGKPIAVEVYSGADEVELFVNGESAGRMRPEKCKAVFHTVFKPGILSAVSYTDGMETGRDELKTASYNVRIETKTENGITEISVVDENGKLNPDADMEITAEGDILGFGTADPVSEENYFDRTIRTWHGRALLISREEGKAWLK